MLNVDEFYAYYGVKVGEDAHMAINDCHVAAYSKYLYIVCKKDVGDPFLWLGLPIDGVVFYSNSHYLSMMLPFDSEKDETEEAIKSCHYLVSQV